MRFLHKKRKKNISIAHYAPDITLTSVDYCAAVPPKGRLDKAEQYIKRFLAQTDPDSLCEPFYDRLAEKDEQMEIAYLQRQKPDHHDANGSIVLKHRAELERLLLEIQLVDTAVKQYESEIKELQTVYDRYNRTGVTA